MKPPVLTELTPFVKIIGSVLLLLHDCGLTLFFALHLKVVLMVKIQTKFKPIPSLLLVDLNKDLDFTMVSITESQSCLVMMVVEVIKLTLLSIFCLGTTSLLILPLLDLLLNTSLFIRLKTTPLKEWDTSLDSTLVPILVHQSQWPSFPMKDILCNSGHFWNSTPSHLQSVLTQLLIVMETEFVHHWSLLDVLAITKMLSTGDLTVGP